MKTLGIVGTALESNLVALKRPYKLNFCATYRCQSRCATCNIWQLKPKDGELSVDEVREFSKKSPHFKWIEVTGGEPFLRSDIVDVVKAFNDYSRGLYVLTMPTNSLCDHDMLERRIKEMLELRIPRIAITVSLDGHRAVHDKIRGVPGNYDRAILLFKKLSELRKQYRNLFVVFGYTMSAFNSGELASTVSAVQQEIPSVSYNDFHINLAQASGNYYHNEGLQVAADRARMVRELTHAKRNRRFEFGAIPVIEGAFLRKLIVYARTGKSPMRSRSLEASCFVDSTGNVYPSIMWNRSIGNVRDVGYDLARLWGGSEAEKIRAEIRAGNEPAQWTSCEAYQALTGSIISLLH